MGKAGFKNMRLAEGTDLYAWRCPDKRCELAGQPQTTHKCGGCERPTWWSHNSSRGDDCDG
jgi:hypothetical protein